MAGISILGADITNSLLTNNFDLFLFLLYIAMALVILGIAIMLYSIFFLKDEELELEEDRLEFEIIKEELRLIENDKKIAEEKRKKVFEPIKEHIYSYQKEVEKVKTSQLNFNDISLFKLISELEHKSLLLPNNDEDWRVFYDIRFLRDKTRHIIYEHPEEHDIRELSPFLNKMIEKIDIKIKYPLSEYDDLKMDDWWKCQHNIKK